MRALITVIPIIALILSIAGLPGSRRARWGGRGLPGRRAPQAHPDQPDLQGPRAHPPSWMRPPSRLSLSRYRSSWTRVMPRRPYLPSRRPPTTPSS